MEIEIKEIKIIMEGKNQKWKKLVSLKSIEESQIQIPIKEIIYPTNNKIHIHAYNKKIKKLKIGQISLG